MMQHTIQSLSKYAERLPVLNRFVRKPAIQLVNGLIAHKLRGSERLFDRLAEQLVEDPCLKAPEFQGSFYMDARSTLFRRLIRDGRYEPELTALCLEHIKSDRDVIDAGANIGFHSVLFARQLKGARVLAVEPTTSAVGRLHRNLELNEVADRVIVHKGALAEQSGSLTMKTMAGREEYSTLGEWVHPSIAQLEYVTEQVEVSTLDALVSQYQLNPGFLKVDVEGAEYRLLQGAEQVLREHRPVIIAELSNALLAANGSSGAQVLDFIRSFNYEILDPLDPQRAPAIRQFGDILCIPRA